ncbi:MAG TPA: helix-hairpin-helix domain-containing protein, partial [Nitrospiria bacterium]
QLSLAIGKNGQNVRLAAKLTGWKIDIMGESEYEKERAQDRSDEIEEAIALEHKALSETEAKHKAIDAEIAKAVGKSPDSDDSEKASGVGSPASLKISGVGAKTMAALVAAGFDSAEKVAASSVKELMAVPGIGEKTAEKIFQAAAESASPVSEDVSKGTDADAASGEDQSEAGQEKDSEGEAGHSEPAASGDKTGASS